MAGKLSNHYFRRLQANIVTKFLLRLLCRHVRRKISADVDWGLSGVSRCADMGERTPIGISGNFLKSPILGLYKVLIFIKIGPLLATYFHIFGPYY